MTTPHLLSSMRVLLLMAVSLSLSSCVNLMAIRDFAAISTDVTAYTALTKDYVMSPRRQKLFQPSSQYPTLDEQAAARAKQQSGLMALHTGMAKYMSALADLSADELVQYDSEVDGLASALTKAKIEGVSANGITAFGSLTKLVSKAATDSYRQKHLKAMIESGNEPFQKVVKTMEFIVDKTFVASLDRELVAVNARYETILHQAQEGGQEAAVYLLKKDVMQRQDETEAKIQACHAYNKSLAKIREGHQSLYDTLGKVPMKEVIRQIKGYKTEVQTAFKAVKEVMK